MERNPHLLFEGCVIACRSIGAKVAYIYIRGEFYTCSACSRPSSRRRGPPATSARTFSARASTATSGCTAGPAPTRRARNRRCSSRSRASARSRGCGRRSRRSWACTGARPSSTTWRPSATCPHFRSWRRVVCVDRPGEEHRAEALLHQRARRAAGRLRDVDGRYPARVDLRLRGRHPRRARAEGRDSRRVVRERPDAGGARRAGQLRRPREGGFDARLCCDHGDGRDHRHGVGRHQPDPLLQARVVRQVHPVS